MPERWLNGLSINFVCMTPRCDSLYHIVPWASLHIESGPQALPDVAWNIYVIHIWVCVIFQRNMSQKCTHYSISGVTHRANHSPSNSAVSNLQCHKKELYISCILGCCVRTTTQVCNTPHIQKWWQPKIYEHHGLSNTIWLLGNSVEALQPKCARGPQLGMEL